MPKESSKISIIVPIGLVGIVLMFFMTLPTFLLDTFQALNITIGLTIFLLSMYIKETLDFSIFPTLLLVTTLFRLALNVSSTKLILLNGLSFDGKLIKAFGNFVAGGNYIVGVILFLILVIVQFLVIIKGSERVAEVAARFTLDAMPGKQMSIDADYNAGLITETEAKEKRQKTQREADFYGAMDGASKFVKGDAIAGLIITVINIIGGLLIGVLTRGEPLAEAATTYTILTIGDGLAGQIPSLLISLATGMVVTRTTSEADFGTDLIEQFLQEPGVLYIVAGTLFIIGLLPGMPKLAFFTIAIGLIIMATTMRKNVKKLEEEKETDSQEEEVSQSTNNAEDVKELLKVDQMELEMGYSLIPLVDETQGGDLLERITMIRKQIATELGIIIPPIRIRDNMQLNPNEYTLKIRGSEITKGELMITNFLAMNPGGVEEEISGIPTIEPAFGLPAIWIPEEKREKAEMLGYTVVDPTSVLATHITETIKKYAPEILGRELVKELIENIKEDYAVVVEEVYPKSLDLGEIQTILQSLLSENVSIRNLPLILEILADASKLTKNIEMLVEYVRSGLARQLCNEFRDSEKKLRVLTLNPTIEEVLKENVEESNLGNYINLPPELNNKLILSVNEEVKRIAGIGFQPIILVPTEIRKPLRRILERDLKHVVVLSYGEITPEVELEAVGMVNVE